MDDVPEELLCPITYEVMSEPIILCETGVTYEKQALMEWLQHHRPMCPVTRTPLQTWPPQIAPNLAIKSLIDRLPAHLRAASTSESSGNTESSHSPEDTLASANDALHWLVYSVGPAMRRGVWDTDLLRVVRLLWHGAYHASRT